MSTNDTTRTLFDAAKGYRTAKYVPYGPVRKVLPYLARRVQENNAIAQQASGEVELIKAELARRAAED